MAARLVIVGDKALGRQALTGLEHARAAKETKDAEQHEAPRPGEKFLKYPPVRREERER